MSASRRPARGALAARGESPASHQGWRCARLARREKREYREYLTRREQCPTQPAAGCSAGRLQQDSYHGLLGLLALVAVLLTACGAPAPDEASPAAVPAASESTGPFAGKTLTVALAPGRIGDFDRLIRAEFERRTGATVSLVGLRSADQVARVRIERSRPTLDVLWIDIGEALVLAGENLLARVTAQEIPNIGEIRDSARSRIGIAPSAFSSAIGFLYNTERLDPPPRAWADLWEPRLRDQLALFDFGSNLGPLTLAMAARLRGGSETNIDPGFDILAALKPNAYGFGTSGPANNNLVAQGEAALTLGLANQARDLKAKGAPVDWIVPSEGALALPQGFQIVERGPEPALARQFLDYTLSKETQTRLANELLLVVTNVGAVVRPELADLVPVDRVIYFDFEAIGARRGAWTDRFNREILGS